MTPRQFWPRAFTAFIWAPVPIVAIYVINRWSWLLP